jgi:hypothetical protein
VAEYGQAGSGNGGTQYVMADHQIANKSSLPKSKGTFSLSVGHQSIPSPNDQFPHLSDCLEC